MKYQGAAENLKLRRDSDTGLVSTNDPICLGLDFSPLKEGIWKQMVPKIPVSSSIF